MVPRTSSGPSTSASSGTSAPTAPIFLRIRPLGAHFGAKFRTTVDPDLGALPSDPRCIELTPESSPTRACMRLCGNGGLPHGYSPPNTKTRYHVVSDLVSQALLECRFWVTQLVCFTVLQPYLTYASILIGDLPGTSRGLTGDLAVDTPSTTIAKAAGSWAKRSWPKGRGLTKD